jgi:streptogramin lyase
LAGLAPMLAAQTSTGDIAMSGFSTSTFGLFTGAPPVVPCPTTGFGGAGSSTSQAILSDPLAPTSFLVGGFGFLGRAIVLGPSSTIYTLLTGTPGIVSQMSWDAQQRVVFADSGTGQVRRFDPATGLVTDLSIGAQPWGGDLSSGALDPVTGDFVAGGNGAIYRLANGASTASATPIASGLGGFVTGIAFDPVTGDVVATVLTVNRVVRVDAAGAVTNVCPSGSVPGPNALDVDQNGDFVAGGGTGQVYRIPRAGGSPTFLVSNTSPLGNVNGIAVVGGGGFGRPFGTACSGEAGPSVLRAAGPFRVGATVTTTSGNHAANALGVVVLGLSNTNWGGAPLPLLLDPLLGTNGCSLHVSGDVTFAAIASAGAPAELAFAFLLTPPFANATFFAQHVALENVPGGLSFSNGLHFAIR